MGRIDSEPSGYAAARLGEIWKVSVSGGAGRGEGNRPTFSRGGAGRGDGRIPISVFQRRTGPRLQPGGNDGSPLQTLARGEGKAQPAGGGYKAVSLLQQRRAFLAAYRKSGSLAKAAESMDLPADIHEKWLADKDGWLYRTAFVAIEKEMKDAGESKSTKGSFSADMKSPTKRPPGRPKKALPPAAKEPKRIGRPPK